MSVELYLAMMETRQIQTGFIAPLITTTFSTSTLTPVSRRPCHRWVKPVRTSQCRNRVSSIPRAEMVNVTVSVTIEAPVDHCYTLFSDLSLMSNWSSTLQSVRRDESDSTLSAWKFSWNAISLSWRAKDIPDDPNDQDPVVRWRAISGLPHTGSVTFTPSTNNPEYTILTMSIDYDIAALVAVVMQSGFVSSFVESAIKSDLSRFRGYALRMLRKKKVQASS